MLKNKNWLFLSFLQTSFILQIIFKNIIDDEPNGHNLWLIKFQNRTNYYKQIRFKFLKTVLEKWIFENFRRHF